MKNQGFFFTFVLRLFQLCCSYWQCRFELRRQIELNCEVELNGGAIGNVILLEVASPIDTIATEALIHPSQLSPVAPLFEFFEKCKKKAVRLNDIVNRKIFSCDIY